MNSFQQTRHLLQLGTSSYHKYCAYCTTNVRVLNELAALDLRAIRRSTLPCMLTLLGDCGNQERAPHLNHQVIAFGTKGEKRSGRLNYTRSYSRVTCHAPAIEIILVSR